MGFIHRKTSKQTRKLKTLLRLAISRVAIARRPRLARKSIATSDVGQLLALGHIDRAIHRVELVIQEGNMLEAFEMIELYCKRLIEKSEDLENPSECAEEIREAAAGLMFATGWCGDLPELLFARAILTDKFGNDFASAAKNGTNIVDPLLVWKFTGNATNMELKNKVAKEIATKNMILLNFSEMTKANEDGEVPYHQDLELGMP
ncbi:hypothetical protein GUJ93_ZPchr0013g33874 [Zizania palustris]|uniref:IST1-like protein n=1 Tax=Zizania palustris TaxID=103762 RepID=A0A8J5WTF4_ZIZPA|nr:hypothetical protein GUJ93_ZPchr0013g34806 [Zizania palustris]KAG8096722.1 hypothetical protein GUJ93_ZPchr0013g33874 [Zizania palustris]